MVVSGSCGGCGCSSGALVMVCAANGQCAGVIVVFQNGLMVQIRGIMVVAVVDVVMVW